MFCVILLILNRFILIMAVKFSDSFTEMDMLASKGKDYLESINEKANVPHYGSCWKKAVAELEIGCKYLSENIQSDLALKFTDCFMQMSGSGPVVCREPKETCLKSLTDRAFNAYVEFYTHTQSMCYFLQSQIWNEEAEKTIDKLSAASMHVSNQLAEAEKIQEELLLQQRQSLLLQHNLLDNSKNLASALEVSRDRINVIMKEFHSSTQEQKKALFDLFDKFSSLRSWAVKEMSWLNSITFYVSSVVLAYFFTSTSRTQQARLYLFLLLTLNYVLEQYIYSAAIEEANNDNNLSNVTDDANTLVWFCRKIFIFSCVSVIVIVALKYCDYNLANYHLLLEIKNQNLKILKQFNLDFAQNEKSAYKSPVLTIEALSKPASSNAGMVNGTKDIKNDKINVGELYLLPYQQLTNKPDVSPVTRYAFTPRDKFSTPSVFNYDATDNSKSTPKSNLDAVVNEKNTPKSNYDRAVNSKMNPKSPKYSSIVEIRESSPYNLRRSNRVKTKSGNYI